MRDRREPGRPTISGRPRGGRPKGPIREGQPPIAEAGRSYSAQPRRLITVGERRRSQMSNRHDERTVQALP